MSDFTTIENYFTGQLTEPEKARFEQQIIADPDLAEAVAFYVQAKATARQQVQTAAGRDKRKAEWAMLRQEQGRVHQPLWVPMAWVAAACVLLLLGFFLFSPKPAAPAIADRYIQENLRILPVTMSSQPDTLQLTRQAYNNGQFAQAEALLAGLQRRKSDATDLLKLAGLVSLRQENYDKAVEQFHSLSQRTDLRANPGLFYEALARLKRNAPNDIATARQLLQTVIDRHLEGKKAAIALINEL